MFAPRLRGLSLALALAACSSTSSDGDAPPSATALPRLTSARTTLEATLVPTTPRQAASAGPNPSLPEALDDYLKRNFGVTVPGPGEPAVKVTIDGSIPPPPGPKARRVARFAHVADLQITDDESPTRLGQFDSPDLTSGALRPQDAYLCRMANAVVRTVNALHASDPIGFVLLGGDNADSAQTNELDWVLGILDGSPEVACDSGKRSDLVAGPDNDGKDPFVAEGLAMPWKWVTGNHDVLVQGNLAANADKQATAIGDRSGAGTRLYEEGGIVQAGDVVPDPRRALLTREALMTRLAADKDGHGIGPTEKARGRATFAFDVPDSPVRFVVIDTAHESGGADGVIRRIEVDQVIKPLLDRAKAEGKWVVLASHHAAAGLSLDGGTFGVLEPDALTEAQWTSFVGGYDNVLFSMVGHSHRHRVRSLKPAAGHAFWEVMTSAIADYPHEFRLVEIHDQDNGWITMRSVVVDFATDGDPVAEEGRRRGVVDFVTGWLPYDKDVGASDRNVELWIKKP